MLTQTYSHDFLAARAEIRDVIYRWCRAIDRLDYDAIGTLFHEGAIDVHGMYEGDVEGLVRWIRERHRTIPFSMHTVSNMLIEFSTADVAMVESYCFAVQRYGSDASSSLSQLAKGVQPTAGGTDVLAFVRYVDRFSKQLGRWLIEKRVVVYDSVMTLPVSDAAAQLAPEWVIGRRNRDDFVYGALQP